MNLRDYDSDALTDTETSKMRMFCDGWHNGPSSAMYRLFYDYLFHDDRDHANAPKGFVYGDVPAWLLKREIEMIRPHSEEARVAVAEALAMADKATTYESIATSLREAIKVGHAKGIRYGKMQHLLIRFMDEHSDDWA